MSVWRPTCVFVFNIAFCRAEMYELVRRFLDPFSPLRAYKFAVQNFLYQLCQ